MIRPPAGARGDRKVQSSKKVGMKRRFYGLILRAHFQVFMHSLVGSICSECLSWRKRGATVLRRPEAAGQSTVRPLRHPPQTGAWGDGGPLGRGGDRENSGLNRLGELMVMSEPR